MKEQAPELYGLILSGGKSTRMGTDKGALEYHGKPQRDYLFELAQNFCAKVFYSIRADQVPQFGQDVPMIIDQNHHRGPFNGILSAHNAFPKVAWLVLACDLPLLGMESIEKLIVARNPAKAATVYATRKTQLPEPLAAIWEPKALERAKVQMQTSGNTGPRKFLINSDIGLVFPKKHEMLYNANSLEEYKHAKTLVKP